ncbi:hypothetical protein FE782_03970 [Paenibacillus antri]|uniref:Fibronectin type-III domain-containing protein n=1 Tax=Paenibacillus antri TaxID=2582848 RepID=A0A5R9GN36_9BACL|nr:Ig-like domain-containing protein [Paenibacillus antri]TLS53435.1 hypothetical protein FE782_03970 [Paenibacillus antri]
MQEKRVHRPRGLRNLVSVFLAAALLAGSMAPGAAPRAAAATGGDLLADTFDAAQIGARPPGWTGSAPAAVSPAPEPYVAKATVEELQGEAGRVFRVEKNGKSTATFTLSRNFSGVPTAKTVLTYKVRAEQTNAVFYLPSVRSGSVVLNRFALYNGKFAYMKPGASGWTELAPYQAGVWHEVRLAMDTDSDTFDLFVDGEMKLNREPMTEGGSVSSMYLGIYKDSVGAASFDEMHLHSYKAAVSASFEEAAYEVAAGATAALPLRFEPADATDQSASWSSDNEAVATVSSSGVVTGVSPGTATITATPREPIPAVSVAVTVFEVPVESIAVSPSALTLPVESRAFLTADALPANSTDRRIDWSSADERVATVDGNGEVTGVGPGTTTIVASTPGGLVRGEATVTVTERSAYRELYVSPAGDDAAAGTLEAPFRTIERAQQEVRALNDAMTGDIVVYLRGGTYTLDEALTFTTEDSGANGYFVAYRSYPGETAALSGGRTIDGWTLHDEAHGIYKADAGTDLATRQLFVDGVRAVRARSAAGLTNPVKTADGYVSDDTYIAGWRNVADLEFVYHELWTNPRAKVESILVENGKAVIRMQDPGWNAVANKGMTSATVPVYYENAYELLDEEGEWYLDRSEGTLYYKPRAWERLSSAEVVAPTLERLLTIKGDSVDEPVRNLAFEGLQFLYTTWMRPSTAAGHADAQNNHLRYPGAPDELPDAAIRMELANTVHFRGNDFAKLGISAIRMENGVQNTLIEGNRFYDISGSAVNVGQPFSTIRDVFNPDDHRLAMKNNDIVNNLIHDIGVDYKSAAAISAGYPLDMDIRHNEIYNIPYSGTHIGYGWAREFDPVTKNVKIQNNLVYDLMGMGVRDGGAFYSLGTTGATAETKNLVSGNYVRNQMDGTAPLYADEGSAYWRYENNVVDLSESPPWHSPVRWASAWTGTIHDLDFVNNYTTAPEHTNNGYNNTFVGTSVHPDANWPAAARAIIAASGLEAEFAGLAAGRVSRWKTEPVNLNVGGSAAAVLHARNGKDEPVDASQSEVYYSIADPSVATVDASGVVTGVGKGATTLTMRIVSGTVLRTVKTDVFVGDTISSIRLVDQVGKVAYAKAGTSKALAVEGETEFGGRLENIEDLRIESSDPAVAAVSEDGVLTARAVGSTVLTMRGTYLGNPAESSILLKVWDETYQGDYTLRSEIDRADEWYVSSGGSGSVTAGDQDITIATPGGHAIYQGRTFQNELLDFDLTVNGSGSWYALMFGNQDRERGYSNGSSYLVTISASAFELQRFNEGRRTVIYGNIAGYESLGGDAAPNTLLPIGETKRVQLGSFEEEGGVRLILRVDGVEVFNYLDTGTDALKGPGYFGLVSRVGSLTIGKRDVGPATAAGLKVDGAKVQHVGESQTLVAKALGADGEPVPTPAGIAFGSSDDSVAVVDASSGTVTALRPGTTVITATYGSAVGALTLTVLPDRAPPAWSEGAALTVSDVMPTAMTLHWPAAIDAAGVDRYELSMDGRIVAIVPGTVREHRVTGLSANRVYAFELVAVDADGSRGAALFAEQLSLPVPPNGPGNGRGPEFGQEQGNGPRGVDD